MPRVALTLKSSNGKTGPIAVSTSSRETCPLDCPARMDGSCYAEAGFHTRNHWDKVTDGRRGLDWPEFIANLAKSKGPMFRHNVAGDLPLNRDECLQLAAASSGFGLKWTYTHHSPTPRNVETWRAMADIGFTVNLSADNLAEADKLASTRLPVTVTLPSGQISNTVTPGGRKVYICPAALRGDFTCADCGLCANNHPNRPIVGFPAHGAKAKLIETH